MILYTYASILRISQLQSDDVKIRSHIEYLIQTHYILVLILYSKVLRNLALMTVFNTLW